MFEDLTKNELYALITGVFIACLIVSNITAGKPVDCYFFTLPSAIIIFPIVYILNDVLAEVYGYVKARRVILLGFFMNLVAVICFTITILFPAPAYFENSEAFRIVLGNTFRLLLAGFAAYLIGSLVNAKLMIYLKKWDEEKLFFRCIVSTFFGESLDALIYISLAFFGTMPIESLLLMIAAQALIKTLYEIICYPFTKIVINKVKSLPDI